MPTLHVGIRNMPEHNFLTRSQDYAKYYAGIIRQGLNVLTTNSFSLFEKYVMAKCLCKDAYTDGWPLAR